MPALNGNETRPCESCGDHRPVMLVLSDVIRGRRVVWMLCVVCWLDHTEGP